jgi:polar amino acid transport system permease protein
VQYRLDFMVLAPYWRGFVSGCALSLYLTALSVAAGFCIGICTALARKSSVALVRALASIYIEAVRNTPLLLQVLFIYFALPGFGIALTPWTAAALALSLNCGAFSAEIIRGGIESFPRGQAEAGVALSLTPYQNFRYVILKPTLRAVYPALTAQFSLTLLASSVVSAISAEELTSVSQKIDTYTFRSFEVYIVATCLYLMMYYMFGFLFRKIANTYFSYPAT